VTNPRHIGNGDARYPPPTTASLAVFTPSLILADSDTAMVASRWQAGGWLFAQVTVAAAVGIVAPGTPASSSEAVAMWASRLRLG